MKTQTNSFRGRHLFAFFLMCLLSIGQMWGATIYSTSCVESPSGATRTSDKGGFNTTAVSWATDYSNYFLTSGSAGYYQLNFTPALTLSSYQNVKLTVHWGSTSNRPLNVSINGGSATKIDEITSSSDRSKVRTAEYSITSSTLSSLKLVSSGGGSVYIFDITITGESAGPVSVTGVSLNKTAISLEEGEEETLTATIAPSNATNKTVTWTSDNEDVATVENGVVTAVAQGNATITVTTADGSKTATCDVTVTAPATKSAIVYANTKGASIAALPTQYSEGVGIAEFAPLADVTGFHFTGWNPSSISASATGEQTITAQWVKDFSPITLFDFTLSATSGNLAAGAITTVTTGSAANAVYASSNVMAASGSGAKIGNDDVCLEIVLNGYNFQDGDIIKITGKNGGSGERNFMIEKGNVTTESGSTTGLATTSQSEQTDNSEYTVTLTEDWLDGYESNTLRIFRLSGKTMYLKKVLVTRPNHGDIASETLAGVKIGDIAAVENTNYTMAGNVITLTEDYTEVPTVTLVNHIVYEDETSKDANVAVEFAAEPVEGYFVGTATIGSTVYTVKALVDNTVTAYFHYVEDFNGAASPWIGYGESWSELTETETIGGAKWYKYTKSLDNVIVSYNNDGDKRTQTLDISALSGEENYYVIYNSWFEETSDDWRMRVNKVDDPTRKTINVYLQNPGWNNLSNFKMWVEDGINGANVYGTTADYDFTSSKTFAGETWYNATLHYFGEKCTIYPKFKENDVQWEAAAGIEGTSENIYIYYNGWNADVDANNKTFKAGVATSMLYAEGAATAATTVSEPTVWDWTKTGATSTIQLADDSYPNKLTEFVMSKILAENANFKSSALTMTTEFVVRDKKYYQGGAIKFTTTVPGVVKVIFSNTGSSRPKRYVHVNGVNTGIGSNSSNANDKTATATVAAGEVVIEAFFDESEFTGTPVDEVKTWTDNKTKYTTSSQYIRIYSIEFTPIYSRDVTKALGSICLPYAVASTENSNATFYEVAGKRVNASDEPTSIVLSEVTELAAGMPYIFEAEDTSKPVVLALSNETAAAGSKNGVYGTFEQLTIDYNSSEATAASYWYAVSSNTFKAMNTGSKVSANRAYLKMSEVPVYEEPATPGAPVRIITLVDEANTATGIDTSAGSATDSQKFMKDGQFFILRNGVLYNAIGQVVK